MRPKLLPGALQRYRAMSPPVLGIFTTDSDPSLKLELLQSLYGMGRPDKIIARAKRFGQIPVIDPVLLLVAKVHNLGGHDQEDR